MQLKMSSATWCPFCLCLNVFIYLIFNHTSKQYQGITQKSYFHTHKIQLQVWSNQEIPFTDAGLLRSQSTLVQVMASCRMAPSPNLNHCWLEVSMSFWELESYFHQKEFKKNFNFDCSQVPLVTPSNFSWYYIRHSDNSGTKWIRY